MTTTATRALNSNVLIGQFHAGHVHQNVGLKDTITAFCRKAMRGINPKCVLTAKAVAFALKNKAEMYENERLRLVRFGLESEKGNSVFQVRKLDDASLIFDVRIPCVSSPSNLLHVGDLILTLDEVLLASFPPAN